MQLSAQPGWLGKMPLPPRELLLSSIVMILRVVAEVHLVNPRHAPPKKDVSQVARINFLMRQALRLVRLYCRWVDLPTAS